MYDDLFIIIIIILIFLIIIIIVESDRSYDSGLSLTVAYRTYHPASHVL